MTPCYEPLKNMLIALGNTFEVIGMQKNNILGEKNKKNTKKRYFLKKNTIQGVRVSTGSGTPVYLILGTTMFMVSIGHALSTCLHACGTGAS